jgi:hypothetical protein
MAVPFQCREVVRGEAHRLYVRVRLPSLLLSRDPAVALRPRECGISEWSSVKALQVLEWLRDPVALVTSKRIGQWTFYRRNERRFAPSSASSAKISSPEAMRWITKEAIRRVQFTPYELAPLEAVEDVCQRCAQVTELAVKCRDLRRSMSVHLGQHMCCDLGIPRAAGRTLDIDPRSDARHIRGLVAIPRRC